MRTVSGASASDAVAVLQASRRMLLRGFILAAAVSFFLNFATLISPLFMIQVYERVLPSKSYDTLYGLIIIGLLGIAIFGLLDFARNWTYAVMAQGIGRQLNLSAMRASVLRSVEAGVADGGRALKDVNDLRSFIGSSSISTPLDALWSVVFVFALYILHPVYAGVAVAFIIIMLILNFVTDALARPALKAANESRNRHVQEVANSLRHAEAIEAMGMLPALVRTWRRSQQEMLEYDNTAQARLRVVQAITKSLHKSLSMVLVATGAFLVLNGSIRTGVLFAGMILTSQAVSPFANMIESWRQWVDAHSAWRRIKSLIENEASARQKMPAPTDDGNLFVQDLAIVPPGFDLPVLHGINFELKPGDVLGVIGPSGAGKSTLARALTGIIKPTIGGVYLDGHSTYLWERGSFGRAVGYVPQSLSLIDGTVRETIARMQESDPRDVIRAAQAAGIHEIIGHLPYGYDTPIQEGTHMLSGGQKQRLALARALYGNPKLIILDEPNSNLDSEGENALVKAVRDAQARNAIVILIAHRPSIMSVANKMLVLRDGRMANYGSRDEVMAAFEGTIAADRRRLIRIVSEEASQ